MHLDSLIQGLFITQFRLLSTSDNKHLYTNIQVTIYMAQSPCLLFPLLIPFVPFLVPLLTWKPSLLWQNPSTLVSDYSQTDLPFLNPFPFPLHSKFPVPRLNMRLTTTTSRIRLLLSGTHTKEYYSIPKKGNLPSSPESPQMWRPLKYSCLFFYTFVSKSPPSQGW
jgi:hypothetical protein